MKLKVNFEELKTGVIAVGKAIKKSPIVTPLIHLNAVKDALILSVNGSISASIKIPADVQETGSFLTTFSSINVISVRKCKGDVNISNPSDNTLLLKYRGNKANSLLTKVDNVFTAIPEPKENSQKMELPLEQLAEMTKETIFVTEENMASDLHSLKLDVEDDEDGIIKFTMTACDGKSLAVRTAYAIKKGDFIGTTLLLPENLKTAVDMFDDKDGNVEIIIDKDKLFFNKENTKLCLKTVSRNFPNMSGLLNSRTCDYKFKVDKREFIEALNCSLYITNEAKIKNGFGSSVTLSFCKDKITIGCVDLSSYKEDIDCESVIPDEKELPGTMFFNTTILKEIVSVYPSDVLEIGVNNTKSPMWLCAGEHDEYIYCVMPRVKRI